MCVCVYVCVCVCVLILFWPFECSTVTGRSSLVWSVHPSPANLALGTQSPEPRVQSSRPGRPTRQRRAEVQSTKNCHQPGRARMTSCFPLHLYTSLHSQLPTPFLVFEPTRRGEFQGPSPIITHHPSPPGHTMGEQDKEGGGSIPSWQQAPSTTTGSAPATLEQARKFLQDESVKESNKETKVEFLKSKGLSEADINTLLEESAARGGGAGTPATPAPLAPTAPTATATADTQNAARAAESESSPVYDTPGSLSSPGIETAQPPIITYPEFLTKPAKPPPLITASGLANSLGMVAGLSAFVYAATRYLVSPMVDSLTDARVDFHDTANNNLSKLVEKLEQAVSEIPESYHTAGKKGALANNSHTAYTDAADDDASSYDDPAELFHRDVGVQTSPPPTPSGLSYHTDGSADKKHSSAVATQQQADKLGRLITSIRDLNTDLASQADAYGGTKNVLDDFGRDLHALTYPPESFGVGSGYLYGTARNEPDDEIKKVKSNIRSVKGVLLSTRSFAAPTR
jgi:hypothetical protein